MFMFVPHQFIPGNYVYKECALCYNKFKYKKKEAWSESPYVCKCVHSESIILEAVSLTVPITD